MRKAAAKLIFLSTLILITSISWMPADAIVTKKVNPRSGTPSQPAPSPTPAPGDGGAPLPCWPLCTGSGLK